MVTSLCSVVVAAPANVGVLDRHAVRSGVVCRGAIEPVLEDRCDGAVTLRADGIAPPARGFQPLRPVSLRQAQDAQTRAEALLGMRLGFHDRLDERGRGRSDPGGFL